MYIYFSFHMLVTLMKIIGHDAAATRQRNDEQARELVHASSGMNSAVQLLSQVSGRPILIV